MRGHPLPVAVVLLAAMLAGTTPAAAKERLRIGVMRDAAPFSYQQADGTWSGLAVDLWHLVGDQLDVESELVGMDHEVLLDAVARGQVAFAVGPVVMTAERVTRMQFSVPYHVTGMALMVPQQHGPLKILIGNVLSVTFLGVLVSLFLLLLVVGCCFWAFERRKNPNDFGGRHWHGIGSGLWLAVVTMTTVGYGDKSPKTLGGRSTAVIWMFASILLISTFTGTVASLLTADRMAVSIRSPEDLYRSRVVTVAGSGAATLLEHERIAARGVDSVDTAVRDLIAGRADAVALDRALLRYYLRNHSDLPVMLLPGTFFPELYALAMPHDSARRQRVDEIVLNIVESPAWRKLTFQYLGDHSGPG
jgi:polar amino acid transport system substrate-binding protein